MDDEPDREELERQVEERTAVLMVEFRSHCADVVEAHPDAEGRVREMFEAWAIQKIAGLQLCIEELATRLNNLAAHFAGPSDN